MIRVCEFCHKMSPVDTYWQWDKSAGLKDSPRHMYTRELEQINLPLCRPCRKQIREWHNQNMHLRTIWYYPALWVLTI